MPRERRALSEFALPIKFCALPVSELHAAAYNADIERARELLQAGLDPNAYDESGYTPLLWAAFRGAVGDQLPVVLLLVAAGADVNAVTQRGDASVLMLAVQTGNDAVVRTLVTCGAEVNRPADGLTPLMLAVRQGDVRMVRTLIELGADTGLRAGQYTAAYYAWYGGHDELANLLDDYDTRA